MGSAFCHVFGEGSLEWAETMRKSKTLGRCFAAKFVYRPTACTTTADRGDAAGFVGVGEDKEETFLSVRGVKYKFGGANSRPGLPWFGAIRWGKNHSK